MNKIIQTGLIIKKRKSDYIAGVNSPIQADDILVSGDWENFLPLGERQNNPFVFDTLSCSTFSGLNTVETWVNYYLEKDLIPGDYMDELMDLGFFKDGSFNASDRFSAMMDNTTKQGNTLTAPWDSFRKDGILAETHLPFSPLFTVWEQYHNKADITDEMKKNAKKILEMFSFSYEWVFTDDDDMELIDEALKKSPLHAGIPATPRHAVMIYKNGYYFNTYEPYKGNKYKGVGFALRGIVTINDINKIYTTIRKGDTGLAVKKLQRKLKINDDGIFGKNTDKAVKDFQKKYKLVADGIVGPLSRRIINSI